MQLRALVSRHRSTWIAPLLCAALLLSACSGPEETDSGAARSPAVTEVATATAMQSGVANAVATETAQGDTSIAPETSSQASEASEADEPAELDAAGLVDEVGALVGTSGGFVEVVLATPDGGTLFASNEQEQLEAASLYKLAVMVEVFRQRDAGLLSFEDLIVIDEGFLGEGEDAISAADIGLAYDIETLLFDMIDLSSNVAATALLWRVGTDNVNATSASLGLAATEIRWYPIAVGDGVPPSDDGDDVLSEDGVGTDDGAEAPDGDVEGGDPATEEPAEEEPASEQTPLPADDMPAAQRGTHLLSVNTGVGTGAQGALLDLRADESLNVTSAADVAALLGMLARGEVVSPESSAAMLQLLQGQEVNDRLPAYLPGDAVVAHKTGNLDALSHDAGIIYTPAGPLIVVVMTEDLDDETANALMAKIGLSVWTHAGGS